MIPNQAGPAEVRHPLSDKDDGGIAALRAQVAPLKGKLDGPHARGVFDDVMEHTPDAAGVRYEEGEVGGVRGIWCRPQSARPGVALQHLHGGGYVLGSAHAYRHFVGQIAARANASAFVAEYRLAPEHAFPAAVDDARAVYRGIAEQGTRRIGISGDSAGGGLALVLLAAAHAEAAAGRGVAPSGAAVKGMTHVFQSSVGSLDAADASLTIMAAFLTDRLLSVRARHAETNP